VGRRLIGRLPASRRGFSFEIVYNCFVQTHCCLPRPQSHRNRARSLGAAWPDKLRKPNLANPRQREAIRRRDRGETPSDIARSFNVHPKHNSTVDCLN
jgi:hypothetical protein